MNAVTKWLEGKKTYAAAISILVVGILGEFNLEVPIYVWGFLGCFGLVGLRDAINKK